MYYLDKYQRSQTSSIGEITTSERKSGCSEKRVFRAAIHWAAWHGSEPIVRLLLDRADMRAFTSKRPALHVAAMQGHANIVNLLLENGAEIGVLDADGYTPLELAIENKSLDVISLLQKRGAAASLKESIVKHGDWLRLLPDGWRSGAKGPARPWDAHFKLRRMDSRHDPILSSWVQYQIARRNPSVSRINLERKRGVLMTLAIKLDMVSVIRALLEDGIDVNGVLNPREVVGLNTSNPWIARLLSKYGKATAMEMLSLRGTTPLHLAARAESEEVLETLINAGATVNAQNYKGQTALHRTIEVGKYSNLESLVKNGGDINIKDVQGRTVPHYFISEYWRMGMDISIFDLFRRCEADFNSKNEEGKFILHAAVDLIQDDLVVDLINNGADVNAADDSGATPLCFAAQFKLIPIASVLLEKGANINVVDRKGHTPLHYLFAGVERATVACGRGPLSII